MVAASIEQLKREFTDKYVKVDANRPELARFRDVVGQVKTVNMSGRALVQFDDYHLNIGWYDIDLSCLTVVEKPSEEAKAAAKAAREKPEEKAAPAAAGKPAAGAKPGGAKLSVAEMMAAARKGSGGAAAPAAPKAAKPAAPAAKPAAGANPAAGGKMSVAEMLAAARAGKGGETASVAAPAAKEAAAEPEAPEAAAPAAAAKKAAGPVDRSSMSVADMIAYCRERDAS